MKCVFAELLRRKVLFEVQKLLVQLKIIADLLGSPIVCSHEHTYLVWLSSIWIGLKRFRIYTSHRSVNQPGNFKVSNINYLLKTICALF